MPLWKITGGYGLDGRLAVQGSKNAVLPILAASLLGGGETLLSRCPRLLDVDASMDILRHLGCAVMQNGGEILINSSGMTENHIPGSLMLRMRSSVIFLGAILARCGEVRLSAPGGCELGSRPIDLHLKALSALGAEIGRCGGEICCRAAHLRGARIALEFPSVGATENAMLAACAAEGETVIVNAAREPEIADLAAFLNAKGACIRGAGSPEIRIGGFHGARFTEHEILPDRIAAATYLCAAAAAGGDVCLTRLRPAHLKSVTDALRQMGCTVSEEESAVRLRAFGRLRMPAPIVTSPYPGFPTDAQALLMACTLRAEGTGVFVENIFENRFRHVPELRRLGADVRTEGRAAVVRGVETLRGAALRATDLRGGAAMVLAGLATEGETRVSDAGHIERGYDDLAGCLRRLGARVEQSAEDAPAE